MTTRLTHDIAAKGFGDIAAFGSQIVSVPMMISAWGTDRYGTRIQLATMPKALGLADGGLAVASRTAKTMVAYGDRSQAPASFRKTTLRVAAPCGALAILLLIPLAVASPEVFGVVRPRLAECDRVALALLIAVVLLGALANRPAAALRAGDRYAGSVMTGTALRLVDAFAMLVVTEAGGSRAPAVAAWIVLRVLGAGWLDGRVRRCPLSPVCEDARIAALGPLRALAFASLAMPTVFLAGLQGVRLTSGAALAPQTVALFAAILIGTAAMRTWMPDRLQPDGTLTALLATAALLHGLSLKQPNRGAPNSACPAT